MILATAVAASTLLAPAVLAHEVERGPYAGSYPSRTADWLDAWIDLVEKQGGITSDLLDLRAELIRQDSAYTPELLARKLAERNLTLERKIDLWGGRDGGVPRWRRLVADHFEQADVEWALAIIRCESAGDPLAENGRSGAAGLFQHLPRHWPGRAEQAGWPDAEIFDPAANIAVAAWLLYEGGGKSHWTCRA